MKFSRDNTFSIDSWTDVLVTRVDSAGNRIYKENKKRGYGLYKRVKDSVELTFLNEDSVRVLVIKSPRKDMTSYKVSLFDELGNRLRPGVSLKNDSLKTITAIYRGSQEIASFEVSNDSPIELMSFEYMHFRGPPILIELDKLENGTNELKFKTYHGYYSKNEKLTIYCKPTFTGLRHGPKKRWLAKKRKIKFLNRLYK
jgi:hypothetical protein